MRLKVGVLASRLGLDPQGRGRVKEGGGEEREEGDEEEEEEEEEGGGEGGGKISHLHESIGHRSSVPRPKNHDDNKLCRTDKASLSFDLTKPLS